MKRHFLVCLIALVVLSQTIAAVPGSAIESNVVKITVRSSPPDLTSPWQTLDVVTVSGSGVILNDRRILTNAHVVEDAVSVEVQRAGAAKRYTATVDFVGHDCDLALVNVDDEAFFEGADGIPLGAMPGLKDDVQVHGFPVGGETLSITSGIISRIEVGAYAQSLEELLLGQIDAPINSGNSGGPVLAEGAVVGLATQSLDDAENVGYMVPVPVITHFLDDVADGTYAGFPSLGAEFQALVSEALRTSLGMAEEQTGVLVARVDHGSPAAAVLRPTDIVLSIDGHGISNEGTVELPGLGWIQFTEIFRSKQIGDELSMDLLRQGEQISVRTTLTGCSSLVPYRGSGKKPEYIVFAGLVFQPLTLQYLGVFEELPTDLGNLAINQNIVTADRSQVILIQKVLPHGVNRGYQEWEDYIVQIINGVIPHDMEHLAHLIDSAEGPWLEIVTEDRSYLTIDLAEARATHKTVLAMFGISQDRLTHGQP